MNLGANLFHLELLLTKFEENKDFDKILSIYKTAKSCEH